MMGDKQLTTVEEGLPQQAEGIWPRHSSSNLMAPLQPGNILVPHERIALNSDGDLWTGYVYHVFQNGIDKGWIPFNPNTWTEPLQFAYSILVEDLTVGIEENENSGAVGIYPNPGNGELWLDLSGENTEVELVRVSDAQGRIVFEQKTLQGDAKLDLRHLNIGHYTISIVSETGTTHLPFIKL